MTVFENAGLMHVAVPDNRYNNAEHFHARHAGEFLPPPPPPSKKKHAWFKSKLPLPHEEGAVSELLTKTFIYWFCVDVTHGLNRISSG